MAGLSSGAKLDLVQASRSPSIVSVALQLPNPGESTGSFARLTDKFPSNTPVWQILRRFESGVAGNQGPMTPNHNFTQRATPHMTTGHGTGAGRLCYEMPVVNVLGRDLASFTDLQKTLGQLGLNSGSALLRLSYRPTEQPLEEAMTTISQYFQAVGESKSTTGTSQGGPQAESRFELDSGTLVPPDKLARQPSPDDDSARTTPSINDELTSVYSPDGPPEPMSALSSPNPVATPVSQVPTETPTSQSKITIFRPPSSSTPLAASASPYNEADYIPTIAHAMSHQSRLGSESRNRRLPSDKELEAQEEARTSALMEIKEIVVALRFPDQSRAQKPFGTDATAADLYTTCRELMERKNDEDFGLKTVGQRGVPILLRENGSRLIGDLGWRGKVLVTVVWGESVGVEARKAASLKEEYREQARELRVEMTVDEALLNEKDDEVNRGSLAAKAQGASGGVEKEAKMMKFLKGLSKK